MDPELSEADMEAINKLIKEVEKSNKQWKMMEESRRIEAANKAASMDEKFDRIIALLEKMMPTPKSESEPELCVPVETNMVSKGTVNTVEIDEDSSEPELESKAAEFYFGVVKVESVESASSEIDLTSIEVTDKSDSAAATSVFEYGDLCLDVSTIDSTQAEVTSNLFSVDFSSVFVLSDAKIGEESFETKFSVSNYFSDLCLIAVCENASMNRPTHFTMLDLSNRLNHILPPKKKIRVLKPPAKPPDDDVLRDVVTWNNFISGLMHCSRFRDAMKVFREMVSLRPNEVTFASVLPSCGRMGLLDTGKMIHGLIVVGEYNADVYLDSSLIEMYCKCREMNNARKGFDRMPERNVVSWSSIISGYAKLDMLTDDRHYLLDLMRVTPRDANYTGQGSKFCILRPELVTSYCQKTKAADKLKPGTGEEVEIQASSESSELSTGQGIEDRPRVPADSGDVQVERTEEETNVVKDCSDAQADINNLVDGIFFNPNAFTEFKLAGTEEEINGDEQSVRKISVYLKDVVVPKFIQDLCTLVVSPMNGQTLTEALHAHGINVRYYRKKSAVSPNHWRADMERHPFKHIHKGTAVADPSKSHGAKLLNEEYSFVNNGLLMWFATEKMVKTYFNYYHGPSIVLIDKELQACYSQAVITTHTVYKDAEWWPFLVSFSNNIFMFSVPRPPEVAEFDHEINLEAKEKVMPFGQAYVTNKVLHLMNKCNQATLKCADVANLEDNVFPKDGGMMLIGNLGGIAVFWV